MDAVVRAQRTSNVSRAAIFSALAGKTLPSPETLSAMVDAWSAEGSRDMRTWLEHRSRCEARLATVGGAGAGAKTAALKFGQELSRQRIRHKLTQAVMAERAGTSAARISRIENGIHFPSETDAWRFDQALGLQGIFVTLHRNLSG
ncbi:DNA-binding XRE family transcriptional regulator/predicted DNA-binding transcriptional regulator AlpA [Actinoplanes octamycinicus]|uniref:DNA-binding XRE family transcriptional regulator/predicted DNA-binding transcriptional regulator AlpA n=1 Tax=Actinoplanes octamycinicus TaxID=135948 RepID=A0A7W7M614_9ACTN|nr:helix-turn-helix transcriptional regulator [Actinoplanes octamycinicus]MBB4738303.1 DNA-binding XRE family transcriptional regulator/predicted DNA-binding transcriptional regulator AlpA [Actinoplanes octamycinicus]